MKHAGKCLVVRISRVIQLRVLTHYVEKGKRRCTHLPPLEDEARILDLRDQILVRQHHCPLLPISLRKGDSKGY